MCEEEEMGKEGVDPCEKRRVPCPDLRAAAATAVGADHGHLLPPPSRKGARDCRFDRPTGLEDPLSLLLVVSAVDV